MGDGRSRAVGAGCPKLVHPDHAEPDHRLPTPRSAVGRLTDLLLAGGHARRGTLAAAQLPTSLGVTCPVISDPSRPPVISTVGDGPHLSIERLMAQLVDQAGQILSAQHRLQRLLDANRTIVSELSLPAVLRQIVESARETAGAQIRRTRGHRLRWSTRGVHPRRYGRQHRRCYRRFAEGSGPSRSADRASGADSIAAYHRRFTICRISRPATLQ